MHVLKSGKTRDPFLAACVWYVVAMADIDAIYTHVRGSCYTVPDLLSSWQGIQVDMQKLRTYVLQQIWCFVDEEMLDTDQMI